MRPSYRAVARRDGPWWIVRIRRERGLYTHVRRLEQAEPMIREVIARVRDVARDSFDVVIEADPSDLAESLDQMAS
jgi:hypothetical protein